MGGQPERLGRGQNIFVNGEGTLGGAAAVLPGRQAGNPAKQVLTVPVYTYTLADVATLFHWLVFRFPQTSGTEESPAVTG